MIGILVGETMITSDSKIAVLSMDIEDWYHLDYFNKDNCDRSFSYLDGVERYCDILTRHQVTSSFFVFTILSYLSSLPIPFSKFIIA